MKYTIVIGAKAKRELLRLDSARQSKIGKAIAGLVDNPRPSGCRKMAGGVDLWRIRAGDYRVIYRIIDTIITVHVVKIGHRKDVYR